MSILQNDDFSKCISCSICVWLQVFQKLPSCFVEVFSLDSFHCLDKSDKRYLEGMIFDVFRYKESAFTLYDLMPKENGNNKKGNIHTT